MSQDNKQVSQKGLKVSVKVTLSVEDIQRDYKKHLKKVASQISVKGFRKGAHDLKIKEVERTRGAMVRVEVIDQLLQTALNEVIKENNHTLAARPEMVNSKGDGEKDPVVCQMSYEVFPEVPDTDLSKLAVDVVAAEVTDADVTSEITKLSEHHGEWVSVKRASKEGDQIKIDFAGRLDGELFEGGSATDQVVELGAGRFLPDFESNLIKKKASDEFKFKTKFPKDYGAENLAGKTVEFEIKVHDVTEKKPLAVGKKLYEAAESSATKRPEFEQEIKDRLESDAKHLANAVNRRRLTEVLKKKISLPLPESTLNQEIEALKKRDEKLTDKACKKKAEESLTLALILRHYIEKFNVKVTEEDIKAYIAMGAPSQMAIDGFYEWYVQDKERLEQVRGAVIEQNALNAILEKVKTKEKSCSITDIEKELKEEA